MQNKKTTLKEVTNKRRRRRRSRRGWPKSVTTLPPFCFVLFSVCAGRLQLPIEDWRLKATKKKKDKHGRGDTSTPSHTLNTHNNHWLAIHWAFTVDTILLAMCAHNRPDVHCVPNVLSLFFSISPSISVDRLPMHEVCECVCVCTAIPFCTLASSSSSFSVSGSVSVWLCLCVW